MKRGAIIVGLACALVLPGFNVYARGGRNGAGQGGGGRRQRRQSRSCSRRQEQKQARECRRKQARERRQERARECTRKRAMIQAFDSDRSGALSDEELRAARGALERLSKGKPGARQQ